ncbi:cell envelope integrity protein CreD [Mucilaginibacter auburnensis]|uniref:Inner membrane protein n=1 Tax=Mucilaginibacter auburnensis TaxID=1457233 RepID=A0A2H9VRG1_9SPHI|nr:cell envelope integrity protein CreD [Mucilaginibacter auburnensis]PJJ83426.1 inner membrane protein [Mucilaginibacter auburnensis]
MIQEQPQYNSISTWLRESVMIKLFVIGFLALVLLIPSSMISSLITERAERQGEVGREIAKIWADSQLVEPPVLVIPYKKTVTEQSADHKVTTKQVDDVLYVLPDKLNITADVVPDTLHRGMFESIVYTAKLHLSGDFKPEIFKGISADQMDTAKARLTFKLTDLKGLKTNPVIMFGNQKLNATPVFGEDELLQGGLQVPVSFNVNNTTAIPFSYTLDIKGSRSLNFLHTGKATTVKVHSTWATPSFTGGYSPDERKINNKGFDAKWQVLYYNRPFAQQWVGVDTLLNSMSKQEKAIFGVDLKLPVDQYQQTTRTAKYAVLIILLTFVALFLTELIRKQPIHPFNYALIGAALVIYYTLLLSFAEQVGYTLAYCIASVATIALVSVFISSLLKNKLMAMLFAAILGVFYVFVYVLIQLEDLALLIGSIALFIILSVLMYFSRKINWDK